MVVSSSFVCEDVNMGGCDKAENVARTSCTVEKKSNRIEVQNEGQIWKLTCFQRGERKGVIQRLSPSP